MLWHILKVYNKRSFIVLLALFKYYDFISGRDYHHSSAPHLTANNEVWILYRLSDRIPSRGILHEENMLKEIQQIKDIEIIVKPFYPIYTLGDL